MKAFCVGLLLSLFCFSSFVQAAEEQTLKGLDVFLNEAFEMAEPSRKVLWVNDDLRQEVRAKIGYDLEQLRVRYWVTGKRTAWILEEIGKERPITMGVVVEDGQVQNVSILVYRESRGGEVQHAFFTDQFIQANLIKEAKRYKLSQSIDGITGATLSVRAVKKVATLALFLHEQTPYGLNG